MSSHISQMFLRTVGRGRSDLRAMLALHAFSWHQARIGGKDRRPNEIGDRSRAWSCDRKRSV